MSINGSLVLNIALGVVAAKMLLDTLKGAGQILTAILERVIPRRTDVPAGGLQEANEEDWLTLWSSLTESTKEEVQRLVDDDQLRRRAKDLDLWSMLWAAAPDETKERLRGRWKAAGIRARA